MDNCQSPFGYSAEVHIQCKEKCQLCSCSDEPLYFGNMRLPELIRLR